MNFSVSVQSFAVVCSKCKNYNWWQKCTSCNKALCKVCYGKQNQKTTEFYTAYQ